MSDDSMRLILQNIDDFIIRNKIQQITTTNIEEIGSQGQFDKNGLWSETIFGLNGTKERRTQFGYINLKTKIIHPELYKLLLNSLILLKPSINGDKYINIKDGLIIETNEDNGNTGLLYIINNFDKIDLKNKDNYKINKHNNIDYISKIKNNIVINKWIVLPAGIRDMNLNTKNMVFSDINNLYIELINNTQMISPSLDDLMLETLLLKIQNIVMQISIWIKFRMKGKEGIFRNSLMKKVMDYTARCVIIGNPNIKTGYIGIPWHVILTIHEPFFIHQLYNKYPDVLTMIEKYLNLKDEISIKDINNFVKTISRTPDLLPDGLKSKLIDITKIIAKDKQVLYKRDPVVTRSNWRSGYMEVLEEGNSLEINLLDCSAMNADFDGDAVALFPLFSKEAQAKAKKNINPEHSKSTHSSILQNEGSIYALSHDAAVTIYFATKE
jgi:DNA-directed RNA polymerase beta' subunit